MEHPEAEQHLLVPFHLDPEVVEEAASGRTGGWTGRRRRPPMLERSSSWIMPALLGAIIAAAIVPRIGWLNLDVRFPPVALAVAALASATLAAMMTRLEPSRAAIRGAGVAAIGVVLVYVAVRASTPVLFVEESFALRAIVDVARLLALTGPVGAAAGGLVALARRSRR